MRTLAEVEAAFGGAVGRGWVAVQGFPVIVDGQTLTTTAVLSRTVVVDDRGATETGKTLVDKKLALVPDEGALRWVATSAARSVGGRVWHSRNRPKTVDQCLALRQASDDRAMRERRAS